MPELFLPGPVAAPGLTDNELAALRPAPRRDADLVARRAAARGREAVTVNGHRYRIWPFLIVAAAAAGYLTAAGVLR